jgi:tetratricopeptide (TPR) repeat protein
MVTVAEAFAAARKYQQEGRLREAELIYQQLLEGNPGDAQLWCLLGRVRHGLNRPADAVAAWQQAIRLQPDLAEACSLLGRVLADQGRMEDALPHLQRAAQLQSGDAETHYQLSQVLAALNQFDQALHALRRSLKLRPDYVDAHASLGITLGRLGKREEAVACLQQALRLDPSHAKAHNNLGVALAESGRREEALTAWHEAIRLKPDYAEAHFNLGVSLAEERRFPEAIEAYHQAIQNRPNYPDAMNNLGLILVEVGRYAEAAAVIQQAIRHRPGHAESHNNLGLALVGLGRYDETAASFQEALRLSPTYPEALNNFGTALAAMARLDDALATYQIALWQRPDYAEVRWNRALALLQSGRYEEGWREYEWRWKRKRSRPRTFTQPAWDGSPLEGKTVLLYTEQGMGDTIQFIRYAPFVKQRGGTVLVEAPPELVPLLALCPGIDRIIPEGEPLPAFDVQLPLMSLPGIMGTTPANVPAAVPYLVPPEDRIRRWQDELGDELAFRVGIVWQGNPRHKWDRHRSVSLAEFAPLAAVEGVRFYSLQKGSAAEHLAVSGRLPVIDLAPRLENFVDTAAVLKALDLVITVDTAVAHLAGALAVPVWVAVSFLSDWRWMQRREDTPWYPTMRLFRQTRLDEWPPVFGRLAEELARLVAPRRRSVPIEVSAGGQVFVKE